MAKLIAACAALAGLSLLLPSEASYDQWAWLVWGREALALELDTTGGPSWKPLPVALAAVVAPLDALGSAVPPALWMVVARTGALLALVFAFRLARRLTGPGLPGIAAGAVAALALALTPDAYLLRPDPWLSAPLRAALALFWSGGGPAGPGQAGRLGAGWWAPRSPWRLTTSAPPASSSARSSWPAGCGSGGGRRSGR